MTPEISAVATPARKPPRLIAGNDKPPSRKPSAAPGSREWASASPIRLMRRRIRNTPIAEPPTDSARARHQGAAHEAEIRERLDQIFVDHDQPSCFLPRRGLTR